MTIVANPSFPVHESIPSGFGEANALQEAEFLASGSINGASKVAQVRVPGYDDDEPGEPPLVTLAVRFRPPVALTQVASRLGREAVKTIDEYRSEYERGWRHARKSTYPDRATTNHAWEDGFLDRVAERPKWHLTYCTDHDNCGEG